MADKTILLACAHQGLAGLLREQISVLNGMTIVASTPADLLVTDTFPEDAEYPYLLIGQKGGPLQIPLRLGAVRDQIRYELSARLKHLADPADILDLGEFWLKPGQGLLIYKASGQEFRLTDKERLFLQTLYKAPGHKLDRKALLETVWDYVGGVETHTLETHLYRLRQKIESCGAKPLIEAGDGLYRLNL